jgi:hypothetical protein
VVRAHSLHNVDHIRPFITFSPLLITTHPSLTLPKMMRLSRTITRPNVAANALRNSRSYVVASQTQRAQEAVVSLVVGVVSH